MPQPNDKIMKIVGEMFEIPFSEMEKEAPYVQICFSNHRVQRKGHRVYR